MSASGPSGPLVCHLLNFFKINIFEKFFQEYHQRVEQFGSRFCPNCKSFQQTTLGEELKVNTESCQNKDYDRSHFYKMSGLIWIKTV